VKIATLGPDDVFYRYLTPKWAYVPLSGAGAAAEGGRFNRIGVEALYLARAPQTALEEYRQDSSLVPPATLASYILSVDGVVDLSGGYDPAQWADGWAEWDCSWRRMLRIDKVTPPSWILADQVISAGHKGILFPSPAQRDRVLLGLGVSHPHAIGDAWQKPLAKMRGYLSELAEAGLPGDATCLAALGPKMLELARSDTAGVHPYLVTPQHTALARQALGPGPIVAPEQGVVLEADAGRARELARKALAQYQTYPNYINSWRRLGFSEEEIASGSDRLVDALFAWGAMERIAERVNEHFAAGADHVCVQAITGAGLDIAEARKAWRELAKSLL